MANNKKYNTGIINGNVAYEIQPDIKKKVNRKPAKKTRKNTAVKFKIMGTVIAIALFSFLTLCRYATIINMSKDLRASKAEIKKIQMDNENITVKLANSNNMKKIEKEAVNKYGMIVPQRDNIVYMDVKELTASDEKPKQTAFQMIQRMLGLIY